MQLQCVLILFTNVAYVQGALSTSNAGIFGLHQLKTVHSFPKYFPFKLVKIDDKMPVRKQLKLIFALNELKAAHK